MNTTLSPHVILNTTVRTSETSPENLEQWKEGQPVCFIDELTTLKPRKKLEDFRVDLSDKAFQDHEDRMNAMFQHDEKRGYITIKVGASYDIELSRIPDPLGLLQWLHHLCQKNWFTSEMAGEFVARVCEIKGWELYGKHL